MNPLYKSYRIRRGSEVHETLLFARKMHGSWFRAGLPYVCIYTYMYMHMCIYIYTCVYDVYIYMYVYACMSMHVYVMEPPCQRPPPHTPHTHPWYGAIPEGQAGASKPMVRAQFKLGPPDIILPSLPALPALPLFPVSCSALQQSLVYFYSCYSTLDGTFMKASLALVAPVGACRIGLIPLVRPKGEPRGHNDQDIQPTPGPATGAEEFPKQNRPKGSGTWWQLRAQITPKGRAPKKLYVISVERHGMLLGSQDLEAKSQQVQGNLDGKDHLGFWVLKQKQGIVEGYGWLLAPRAF